MAYDVSRQHSDEVEWEIGTRSRWSEITSWDKTLKEKEVKESSHDHSVEMTSRTEKKSSLVIVLAPWSRPLRQHSVIHMKIKSMIKYT